MATPRDTIPLAEVARRVGKSEATIRRWIAAQVFPGYRYGQSYIVTVDGYEMWKRMEWPPKQEERAA